MTDSLEDERQQYNLNEQQKKAVGISEWVDLKRIGEELGNDE